MPKTAKDPLFATTIEPIFAARNGAFVTPSDTEDLSNVTSGLIVTIGSGGGSICVIFANGSDQQQVTIPLAPGTYQFSMQVRRILATGTVLGSDGAVAALWS